MVADILRLAAVDAYDIAVLLTGDSEQAPAVEALRILGKQAFVASWGGAGLSPRLRRVAFDHVDLLNGVEHFETERLHEPSPGNEKSYSDSGAVFLEELSKAEEHFKPGFVGLNYFITRWSSPGMDSTAEARRHLLDSLVEECKVEVYEATNGDRAIRTL